MSEDTILEILTEDRLDLDDGLQVNELEAVVGDKIQSIFELEDYTEPELDPELEAEIAQIQDEVGPVSLFGSYQKKSKKNS